MPNKSNTQWHDEQPADRGRGLVAHPLFPAIAALWIAALLAVGSMTMPAGLLERAAAAARIDQLVPAARPPLGFTARLLVAFALAIAGGLGGYVCALAWRRRSSAAPAPSRAPAAATVVPTGDDEEDFLRLAAAQAPTPRRRALISESAENPSILEISAISALEPLVAQAPLPTPPEAEQAGRATPPWAPAPRPIDGLSEAAAGQLAAAPLESLGLPQLVERFALALRNRRRTATPDPLVAPIALPPFAEPGLSAVAAAGRPFDGPAVPASPRPAAETPWPRDAAAEPARWPLSEPEVEGEADGEDLALDPPAGTAYGSLTEMRPVTRTPAPLGDFIRIDDSAAVLPPESGPQPVVVFPGQAVPAPPLAMRLPGSDRPASPEETEQALREALAALQRMSGAG